MEEGLNVAEVTPKRLQLHSSADTQDLQDLHLAAKHRNSVRELQKQPGVLIIQSLLYYYLYYYQINYLLTCIVIIKLMLILIDSCP